MRRAAQNAPPTRDPSASDIRAVDVENRDSLSSRAASLVRVRAVCVQGNRFLVPCRSWTASAGSAPVCRSQQREGRERGRREEGQLRMRAPRIVLCVCRGAEGAEACFFDLTMHHSPGCTVHAETKGASPRPSRTRILRNYHDHDNLTQKKALTFEP